MHLWVDAIYLVYSVEGFGYCVLSGVISEIRKTITNNFILQLCKVNGGVFDQSLTVGFGLFLI